MGYKGSQIMDAGYIYAPYVPLTSTPVALDPANFVPRKGLLTRYGKKLLQQGGQYYDTVSLNDPAPLIPPKYRSIDDNWGPSQW